MRSSLYTVFLCYFFYSLSFVFLIPTYAFSQKIPKKITIFGYKNGKGLELSRQILKNMLLEMGHSVFEKEADEKRIEDDTCVDINIFLEQINAEWFSHASVNWFIPNPEWYYQSLSLLDGIDLVLCRTHEVERIFTALNKKTYFLGFSSLDCYDATIEKNFSSYLHVAGGSYVKGTDAIAKAWLPYFSTPDLTMIVHYEIFYRPVPKLKVIKNKLPLHELRSLQNGCGVHLCTSETEGFGHYLMEAMSTGAVVVTTDAPPMNEFIIEKRCLVSYESIYPYNLAQCYKVHVVSLFNTIQNLIKLPVSELKKIGEDNRLRYFEKTNEFRKNIARLMDENFVH